MRRSPKASHDAIVVEAIGLLRAWIARDHRLYEVASALGVSHGFLEGLFKGTVGVDLTTYRTFIRIERAQGLLGCLALPIGEVARLSGFSRQAYFAKVFRDATGVTPTEYRAGLTRQADPGVCPGRTPKGCALVRFGTGEAALRPGVACPPPAVSAPPDGTPEASIGVGNGRGDTTRAGALAG
jgi:AraC-like DNA-binding protein